MSLIKNLTKVQMILFAILICGNGVLGYLFYDSYRTNIRNHDLIAESKIENKDLSQDLDIVKDKYEKLQSEVDVLKNKVAKVSYKKKYHGKKRKLYSAGKSNKKKKYYRRGKVNYKKLYFELKRKCGVTSKQSKYYSKSKNYSKTKTYSNKYKYKSTYKQPKQYTREYKR